MEMSYTVVRILQRFERVELDTTTLMPSRRQGEEKLLFKNGKENLAWRMSREHGLRMKTDILLTPGHSYRMSFVRGCPSP